jgi:hypothetical protein
LFGSALRKLDGQDIVCKGSRAATKYVFQLPGYLDMSQMTGAGGVFGEIADMNTPNPLLYIDFPQVHRDMFVLSRNLLALNLNTVESCLRVV